MKRRLAECFQPDSITRQIEGKKHIQEEIDAAISKLKSLDPSFVMRNNVFLKEDQALLFLSATMGLHGVVILKLALDHVPPTLSKTMRGSSVFGFHSSRTLCPRLVFHCRSLKRNPPLSSWNDIAPSFYPLPSL